jgi:hypothetical protein
MAKRRAVFALLVAAGLALSTSDAWAGGGSRTPQPRPVLQRTPSLSDGLASSLIVSVRDRLADIYRTIRGSRVPGDPFGGTGYHTDGITDGPEGVDPLGAKSGLGGARPAQTRRHGI